MLLSLVLVACSGSQSNAGGDQVIPPGNSTPAPFLGGPATEEPTLDETDAPEPAALPVSKVSLTSSVSQGGTAKLTIKTAAKAECSITVQYASGYSEAAGLVEKTANSDGKVTWSWTVGSRTTKGAWPISVHCIKGDRDGSLELMFRVK